ncbi:hypothetical protein K402DRAFT_327367 [Aulographum hederae CBS 113979]|uniref:Conserved oligomeric Golgi complex subunit 1 n=1 Tax=Aulographum hederae CBS 113979 TaxID=1176131 RepID=A0A6G1H7W7_9PEZI|nr:hypothetical protein K402DRAFT_327367 [Aulographum hederae CBS 113979]
MTTEAPNPRDFKSWEDAFQYPVPAVRKLEQQLRGHASENREKLRTLVGASYRELLGTAERIIEMDDEMQRVENALGAAGRKCNSRAIEHIFENFAKLEGDRRSKDTERNALAAQLAVLQACPTVISRLLRNGESSLLASKVLVLSRLLHKSLAQIPDAPPLVDTVRNRLAAQRRRLLSHVDRQLSSPHSDTETLIENMCAFSLATSSTPTDVLRHFHHVRLEAVKRHFSRSQNHQENILQALQLFVTTLRNTQQIFPARLSSSLAALKAHPLLRDKAVLSLTVLHLDIHARWIAEDIRSFTPWPRHDELHRADAEQMLKAWAKQALQAFLGGMKLVLVQSRDFNSVLSLRKEMLETWLNAGNKAPGLNAADVLDSLREVLNDHLRDLVRQNARNLRLSSEMILKSLSRVAPLTPTTDASLWDASLLDMSLNDGASNFKQALLKRTHGRNATTTQVILTFEEWAESMRSTHSSIKAMKDVRWDDDLAIDEDSFDLDSKQALLSQDDPQELYEALSDALVNSFAALRSDLDTLTSSLATERPKATEAKGVILIRIIREIDQRSRSLGIAEKKLKIATLAPLVSTLHERLAASLVASAMSSFKDSLAHLFKSRRCPARALWEGRPPLPNQPSTSTFKLLRTLSQEMSEHGSDLWAPGAVRSLKITAAADATSALETFISDLKAAKEAINVGLDEKDEAGGDNRSTEAPANASQDGPAPDENQTETVKIDDSVNAVVEAQTPATSSMVTEKAIATCHEKLIQSLFDALYLQRAFSIPGSSTPSEPLASIIQQITLEVQCDGVAVQRLRKNAVEYWKRTYLLFGLLA